MTPERWQRICDVFQQVRRREPTERDTLLQEACGEDADLRAEVERLLADDAGASRDGFLDLATEPPSPTASFAPAAPILERPGDRVGPYRLLQPLGEGGMGAVFLAEQDHPVRRRVALKLIKPGMDSAQVIARFAAERQALAMMDHPNIARVLDAGATEAGRPFFVMELVKGVAITEYCDRNRLTPRQRLELFIPVCRAIQHAHQKGIIHRDIKPSNVLVTLVDGEPVPKVIDFGVAKAIDQRLTEQTIFTQLGAIVGTPAYMSPEQADLSALDVDTRTDVYSLGVLLYELLTGTTPLERERLRGAAYAEIVRRIREEEPPKPSTRLSGSGEALATIAGRRGIEPSRLARLVRGELDWIAMKCLEKDRTRRYETAASLARDVERYLAGEAVEAGPPSAWYQVSKLARRHRTALAVAASFAVLLIAGTAFSAYQAFRATRAEKAASRALEDTKAAMTKKDEALAESEAVTTFLVEAFKKPDPAEDGEKVTVARVLDQAATKLGDGFAGSPRIKGVLLNALGRTYLGLGLYEKAVATHDRALAVRRDTLGPDDPDTITSLTDLATAYREAGRPKEALPLHEKVLRFREANLGPAHALTINALSNLAGDYYELGQFKKAIELGERVLKLREDTLGRDDPQTLVSRDNVASSCLHAGLVGRAIAIYEQTLALMNDRLGPDHPDTLTCRNNLGEGYRAAGQLDRAIAMHEQTLALVRDRLEPDHPRVLVWRDNLAAVYQLAGRPDRAIALHERTLELMGRRLSPDHPDRLTCCNNLAEAYRAVGRLKEAIALHGRTLALMEDRVGAGDPRTFASRGNLARSYLAAGEAGRAEPLLRRNLEIQQGALGPEDPRVAITQAVLGYCLIRQSRSAEAEPILRRSLAIRAAKLPDDWTTFNIRSWLGASLMGQGRFAEAREPVVAGYRGMKAREAKIPAQERFRLAEAGSRIVALYDAWGKPAEADAWRAELGLPPLPELPADVFAPSGAGRSGG